MFSQFNGPLGFVDHVLGLRVALFKFIYSLHDCIDSLLRFLPNMLNYQLSIGFFLGRLHDPLHVFNSLGVRINLDRCNFEMLNTTLFLTFLECCYKEFDRLLLRTLGAAFKLFRFNLFSQLLGFLLNNFLDNNLLQKFERKFLGSSFAYFRFTLTLLFYRQLRKSCGVR